jgi:hypothetical protein
MEEQEVHLRPSGGFAGSGGVGHLVDRLGVIPTLEMAAVFAELMGQLDHPQSVGAGADEFRR